MNLNSTSKLQSLPDETFQGLKGLSLALRLAPVFLFATLAYAADFSKPQTHWVGSWAASQQLVEPANSLATADIRDATLRQIVHLSLGGNEIRLRLSNRFGTTELHLAAVDVAKPLSPNSEKIVPDSHTPHTFSGSRDVTI